MWCDVEKLTSALISAVQQIAKAKMDSSSDTMFVAIHQLLILCWQQQLATLETPIACGAEPEVLWSQKSNYAEQTR